MVVRVRRPRVEWAPTIQYPQHCTLQLSTKSGPRKYFSFRSLVCSDLKTLSLSRCNKLHAFYSSLSDFPKESSEQKRLQSKICFLCGHVSMRLEEGCLLCWEKKRAIALSMGTVFSSSKRANRIHLALPNSINLFGGEKERWKDREIEKREAKEKEKEPPLVCWVMRQKCFQIFNSFGGRFFLPNITRIKKIKALGHTN